MTSTLPSRPLRRPGDATGRDVAILVALSLVVLGLGIGWRAPWPADEPRFALIAEEMVATGEWLFPHRAAELYAHKPPLFFWSIAVGYQLTGNLRVAFLLPSLLAGLGTVLLVFDLARRLWNRRVAWCTALTLLAIVQFPLQARAAQIDASVTFWTTLALYGLCRHLLLGPAWRWWSMAFFAMGLGIITKGVGFLPLLALLPWALARIRGWRHLPVLGGGWRWWLGPPLILVGVALWVVPMLVAVDRAQDPDLTAYRNEILWGQTAERYANFEGHKRPLLYYPLQVIPLIWLPASWLLPWLVPIWWRRLRRRDARYLVLLGWIGLVLLFFTFSSGKRGVYILPAVPAMALACGPLIAAGLGRLKGPHRLGLGLLATLTTVFLALTVGGLGGQEWALEPARKEGIEPWGMLAALGLAGLGWLVFALWRRQPRRGLEALGGLLGTFWILYGVMGYPLLDPVRSTAALMTRVADQLPADAELGLVGWKEQIVLHADRPVTHWGFFPDHKSGAAADPQEQWAAGWLAEAPEHRWLLIADDHLAPCFDPETGTDMGEQHRRRWILLDARALTGRCGPGTDAWPGEGRRYRTDWMADRKMPRSSNR